MKSDKRKQIIEALEGDREIVINADYGGFSISEEVGKILKKNGVKVIFKGDKYSDGSICSEFYGYLENDDFDIKSEDSKEYRADKRLIEAIKKVGFDKANGNLSKLRIVKIPSNVDWEIEEYDGSESIHEKHRSWN